MLLLNQAVLLLLVALAGRCAEARAVVREDVKGVAALLQDEARDDPFFDHNPQYDFAYRIHDEETGDAKDQTEERRGDAVQGSYSVVDPDGTLRVVRYTADDANGFNAVVSLTPGHAKPFVPKPTLQRRVAVVQNHVDVPVPVQHHVLPSTSQQILGDQRVLVEHPKHQASAQVQPLVQQHLIQPPLAFGLHQDVHHLIPRGPTYQLHHIHQLSPSGVGTHHQMTVPIVQIQDQGNMDAQQQHMAFLQVQQEQFKKQQEQVQAMIQAQQQGQLFLAPQPQKQAMNSAQQMEQQREGLQDAQPVQQQQQQQQQQQDQQSSILQDQQGSVIQQQTSISQEQGSVVQQDGVSQQQDIDSQQQENVIQQQDESSSGFSLPQVIDVRHSVVQKPEQGQALSPQSQVRSLDGGVLQSGRVSPHQRTLAVYRTSSGVQGGGNFITFSSPYAQYTVS